MRGSLCFVVFVTLACGGRGEDAERHEGVASGGRAGATTLLPWAGGSVANRGGNDATGTGGTLTAVPSTAGMAGAESTMPRAGATGLAGAAGHSSVDDTPCPDSRSRVWVGSSCNQLGQTCEYHDSNEYFTCNYLYRCVPNSNASTAAERTWILSLSCPPAAPCPLHQPEANSACANEGLWCNYIEYTTEPGDPPYPDPLSPFSADAGCGTLWGCKAGLWFRDQRPCGG